MLNGGLIAAPCRQHLRVATNKPTDERLEPRLRKDEESVMKATVNTVVVGGGQAGLSVSHYLKQLSVDHVVLERADKPGEAWRNHRWDSFALNTPRWQSRLLGVRYGEDGSDGFMPRREVVAHLDEMAQRLPVRTRARVVSVARDAATSDYVVSIDDGEKIRARNVVVATGLYQTPKIPEFGRDLLAGVRQLHSDSYRNPAQLLPGAVLVVGSAQSGAQIAEELYESGRKVYLATGRAGRTPRRYRGKDANWWLARMGHYDHKVSELSSPRANFGGKPHISGTKGGHTLNLHQFARDGVTLLGGLEGIEGGIVKLKGDLDDNLAEADRAEAEFVQAVDAYVANTGMSAPEETLPVLRDGFDQRILTELDLAAAGVTNVIWATGYTFDFSMIRLAVTDDDGFPIQTRGVSAFPGLFFVGLPWLHTAKSGLIFGVSEDARYIAERIAERRDAAEDERAISLLLERSRSQEPKRSRATRKWADGVTALASAAIVSLALTASSAAEAPLPPRVNFIPTPAGQLYLGMTTRSGSWAKLQGRQTSQSARHKYASLNSSTQFPAKSSSRTEKCRTSGWTRSGWKRILSRRPPGRPGWGSQAARCDAPSVNLKPFFITPSSGSASISGFTRAPARTSVCSSGPTA
jgi:putative flavoprotein involved in K+ transport